MDINRTCVHELVHIVLARGYGRIHIPRWFHEGMAMTLSGELSSEEQVALSKAIFTNHLLSLDTIENLNRFDRAQADLGYAISHFTVQFLIEIYGLDALPELLHASEHTRSFDNALTETVGLNQKELQQLVNTRMIARFKYLFLTSDGYLAWVGIVLLAVVAFVTIKLRNRKKRRLMEEAESLEEEIMKTEDGKPDEKDSYPDKAK